VRVSKNSTIITICCAVTIFFPLANFFPTTFFPATAISAGQSHTCALLDDKSVKCWGYNYYAQLGLGDTNTRGDASGEMGDDLPAVDLG
jgi:alpha-tubulin suppressor-like RCC1 family protein